MIVHTYTHTYMHMLIHTYAHTYTGTGAMMSTFLIEVTDEGSKWSANVITDIILALYFCYYYKFSYMRRDQQESKTWILDFRRLSGYVIFPGRGASILGALLSINLVCARIPALYHYATEMEASDADRRWSYDNAMLLVQLTMIPIFCYAMYWSLSLMLFRKEFTASPGDYNAIHDPMIGLVGSSVMIEGALDVVSAAAFMTLGTRFNIHTYTHTCIHTYIHACMHTHMHLNINTYMSVCTYIHTHIHTLI